MMYRVSYTRRNDFQVYIPLIPNTVISSGLLFYVRAHKSDLLSFGQAQRRILRANFSIKRFHGLRNVYKQTNI